MSSQRDILASRVAPWNYQILILHGLREKVEDSSLGLKQKVLLIAVIGKVLMVSNNSPKPQIPGDPGKLLSICQLPSSLIGLSTWA